MAMTTELWIVLIAAMIPGLLALAAMGLSNIFAWNERDARIDNLDADTIKTNEETIKLMQETAAALRRRVNNLETEIGEEKALRRKDKQTFEGKLVTLKKQSEGELADLTSKYEYEMRSLSLRVKELEDELGRSEKRAAKAQKERDEARAENHGLLEENYQLRQEISGKK